MSARRRVWLLSGVLAWAGAAAFGVLRHREQMAELDVAPSLSGVVDAPVAFVPHEPVSPLPRWTNSGPPAPEFGGIDLFTAPTLYLDEASGALTALSPRGGSDAGAFGLELLDVWREPFQIQLVGYVGGGGVSRGVFEEIGTGSTRLARSGDAFDELRLRVLSFNVRRDVDVAPGGTPLTQTIAVAEVLDLTTGEIVRLSTGHRRNTRPLRGRFRVTASGEIRELSVGGELAIGGVRYQLQALEESPAAAEVVRVPASDASEGRRLTVP